MADGLTIEMTGADKVINVVGNVPEKLGYLIMEAIVQAARNTLEDSQRLCPIDTGKLQASGRLQLSEGLAIVVYGWPEESTDKIYDYGDYQADGYAWFQELGTSKMAAQPYLYPAFEENALTLQEKLMGILSGDITI